MAEFKFVDSQIDRLSEITANLGLFFFEEKSESGQSNPSNKLASMIYIYKILLIQ